MAEKKVLKMFKVLKTIAILSFVVTCGSCLACNSSTNIEYGEEEFYQKPFGGVGYGGKTYFSGGHPFDLIAMFSGVLFFISGIGTLACSSSSTPPKNSGLPQNSSIPLQCQHHIEMIQKRPAP
jgi:hypothetical protein